MKVCSACKRCFDDTAESCVDIGHPQFSDPRPGHRLMVPGYSLDQHLAESNKADVYLSRRLDCDRLCIVKIVSANTEDGEAFLRDAGLAAGLFDERIADIYEAGNLESGQYFVVEEFDEGQTLRGHLDASGAPNLLASIRIVEQIAEGLHALHLKGLTHGAVRPENIFLSFDDEGRPAIRLSGVDLGGVIARNIISNKFVIDSALDTIRYFAPEQCSGIPACPQTDVYSLGVVLYELLAGVPPFDAPKATALMDMHRSQRPPEVMIDDLDLRMLVAHSLSEALQKQPSFRQCSADLLARQMRHIEQLATHVSTPPPAVTVPVVPPVPLNAAVRPSSPQVPAVEPAREDSFGTAFARAVDITPDIESVPAAPPLEPVAAHDDVGEPSDFFQEGLVADEPQYVASEAARETIREQWGSVALPDVELPDHKASALTGRRHRLRRWKRITDPVEAPQQAAQTQPGSNLESDLISRLSPSTAFDLSHPAEEARAEPAVMPKLIDWEQPDDIPAIDEAEADSHPKFAAFDQAFSESITEAAAEPGTASPHLIVWEQPEDDIPSVEDVIEARSNKEATEVGAIHFTPEDLDVVAAIQRRLKAEADETEGSHHSEAVIESEPRKAIDVDFVPTILGERHRHVDAHPRPQYASILDAYEPPQVSRSVPYRSISIGVLLMAVAAVIGLGGDPVWQYFTAQEPDRSVAEVPSKEERIPAKPARSAKIEPPTPVSEPATTFFEDIPAYDGPGPAAPASKPGAPRARARGQARRGAVTSESPRTADAPIQPSTLVITYGNGGVKSSNSAHSNSRDKEARPPGEKTAGATRPRIVAIPWR